jgi:hypothetical protein
MAIERKNASQQEKYIAFKTAYGMLKHYEETENYIAAYVIAFSILEDRIKAMFAVSFHYKNSYAPQPDDFKSTFVSLVNKVSHWQFLTSDTADKLKSEADNRNKLLHAAMWRLDAFTPDTVKRVKHLVNVVEKELRVLKKEVKAAAIL